MINKRQFLAGAAAATVLPALSTRLSAQEVTLPPDCPRS